MKILIVHPCKGFHGGAEVVVEQLSHYLKKEGHEPFIVTKHPPMEWLELEYVYPTASWTKFFRAVKKVLPWADVVNIHNPPATLATFPKKVPTVWYCHEPMEMFSTWWRKPIELLNRVWVRQAGMTTVVADSYNKRRFENTYGLAPLIVPYGVDYKFWSHPVRVPYENKYDLKILHVGTLSPYKNQLESLWLLINLIKQRVNASLTLVGGVGDKSYARRIGNAVSALPPETRERISYQEHVDPEDLRALYRQHDILHHPVIGQGGWLVPFEAMCAELPVIVGPEFPAADLIQRWNLGLVSDDPVGAVERAEHLALKDLSGDIKEWLSTNLTWDAFGYRMMQVFEKVAE